MGQHFGQSPSSPLPSSAPLSWDGKCRSCRKLMSRCVCFQETESDVAMDRVCTTHVVPDATETRPLWNALRKMHRTSGATRQSKLSSPVPLSPLGKQLNSKCRARNSAALPPLSVPPPVLSSSSSRSQHVHRRSEARAVPSSRCAKRESSHALPSNCRTKSHKERLQRDSVATSASTRSSCKVVKETKTDCGGVGSMRSTGSTNRHSTNNACHPVEKFHNGPVEEMEPCNGSEDGTVWEL
uniref:Uncharacterized protein n=1 Tax=Peronospora matthiolae TaxID=2874970 RepID=A0AAV1V1Q1_9STRA